MNEVIKTLTNHRSYREYDDQKQLTSNQLDAILSAAQAAPTWIHGQQVSVIVVQDKTRKKKLAELCGNQEYINQAPTFLVFCADFNRAKIASEMEGTSFEAIDDADALLVGATDVGIGISNAIAASESLGLGIVTIGGIRKNPLEVIKQLELPKYVIPIAGLCIGHGLGQTELNPRLPKEAFIHKETYNHDQETFIKTYNEVYKNYLLKRTNGKNGATWTKRVASFYAGHHYNNNYPEVPHMLKQQGFRSTDLTDK